MPPLRPYLPLHPCKLMENLSEEVFARAFVDVLRAALAQDGRASVPGLGTFTIRHEPSWFVKKEDGDTVLRPPRDVVEFAAGPILTPRRNA
jgi:nucleoid DNA-binding protein